MPDSDQGYNCTTKAPPRSPRSPSSQYFPTQTLQLATLQITSCFLTKTHFPPYRGGTSSLSSRTGLRLSLTAEFHESLLCSHLHKLFLIHPTGAICDLPLPWVPAHDVTWTVFFLVSHIFAYPLDINPM